MLKIRQLRPDAPGVYARLATPEKSYADERGIEADMEAAIATVTEAFSESTFEIVLPRFRGSRMCLTYLVNRRILLVYPRRSYRTSTFHEPRSRRGWTCGREGVRCGVRRCRDRRDGGVVWAGRRFYEDVRLQTLAPML